MKRLLLSGLFALVLAFGLQPGLVNAQFDAAKQQACQGLDFDEDGNGSCDQDNASTVDNTVAAVINIASLVGGVIAVIVVIVGGIKYVTSQGDSQSTASAKNTVIYAVVGLIIIALAQVIVRFVVNRATDDTPPPAQSIPAPDADDPSGAPASPTAPPTAI
jgi:cytochrome bd-type quinol oxidase subunit 2